MKSAVVLFCLVIALAKSAAQTVISPTNHIELFNGTNFDGFAFCMKNTADPMQTWSVTNGVIHCNGAATGYLRTLQSYSNYVITVEWRFLNVTPKKNNTGVLVHMQLPDKVWPPCMTYNLPRSLVRHRRVARPLRARCRLSSGLR